MIEGKDEKSSSFQEALFLTSIPTMDDKCGLPMEVRMKIPKSIPNNEFIVFQLDKNPSRMVKLEANIPHSFERSLIKCLKANINLFIISSNEMPDINLVVACH